MEPFQASTQITGGYFTKGDPSTPMGGCYMFRNNDPIRYLLFTFLTDKQRAKCATVCKQMHRLVNSENEYYKWQFVARLRVLKAKSYGRDEELLNSMRAIEENKQTNFKKFAIPKETSLFVGLFSKSPKEKLDPTLLDCQKRIESQVSSEPHIYQMDDQHYYDLKLEDPKNEYEKQAYHDVLYPVARLIAARAGKESCRFPIFSISTKRYALPTFLAIAEGIFRESKLPHQIMLAHVTQATSPDDFGSLNNALAHASHLEMLTFTSLGPDFSWTAGNGLAALKSGLVRSPKLRILHFQDLEDKLLDEKCMLDLADIIKTRQKIKGLKPFEEIRFGNTSVRPEVAWKLVEALKDYPVPIVIFLSGQGNIVAQPQNNGGAPDLGAMFNPPFPIEDIKRVFNKINIRWDGTCNRDEMKMQMCCALDQNSSPMRGYIHLSVGIKYMEDKRNKGKI